MGPGLLASESTAIAKSIQVSGCCFLVLFISFEDASPRGVCIVERKPFAQYLQVSIVRSLNDDSLR